MVVQHNMQAMNANRMLNITTGQQAKSTEKLSSGYRINRAADDAAGLTISEKMRKQIRGLDQASTNAQDGVSAVQTAEGALTEVHSMLQRMNELAVQSANGTNAQSDRDAIQAEITQLTTEINRVSETTKFNETYLLKGDTKGTKDVYFGTSRYGIKDNVTLYDANKTQLDENTLKDTLAKGGKVYKDQNATQLAKKGVDYAYVTKFYDVNGKEVSAEKAATGGAAVYGDKNAQIKISDDGTDLVTNKYVTKDSVNDDLVFNLHVGADSEINNKISVTIEEMSSKGLGVEGLKVDTEDDATVSIDTISAAIQKVSSQRSALGAVQNRLEHTIDNLDNVVENTTAAESRIRDTDMAEEMVNYSKNNILAQAGQSMLAQANQSTQGVLSLLQ